MSTIRITVNGKEHTVDPSLTLEQLLSSQGFDADPAASVIATAVNGRHVARHLRNSVILNDQDAVTTFEPISGG